MARGNARPRSPLKPRKSRKTDKMTQTSLFASLNAGKSAPAIFNLASDLLGATFRYAPFQDADTDDLLTKARALKDRLESLLTLDPDFPAKIEAAHPSLRYSVYINGAVAFLEGSEITALIEANDFRELEIKVTTACQTAAFAQDHFDGTISDAAVSLLLTRIPLPWTRHA